MNWISSHDAIWGAQAFQQEEEFTTVISRAKCSVSSKVCSHERIEFPWNRQRAVVY